MSETMQSWDPRGAPVTPHLEVATALLPLKESEVLSVTTGVGDIAPAIAAAVKTANVVVFETERQTEDPPPLSNLTFKFGEADRLPENDESFDVVIVNGLLSRMPDDRMDAALREVRRVLRPGGLAYFAEPVFGGALNDVVRGFADEKEQRLAAFDLICGLVSSGAMALVEQKFFQMPLQIADFAAVERDFVPAGVELTSAQKAEARKKFERHMKPGGATFKVPMRVDLLRKSD